ncbi:MAG: V-type ATP synthase subunit E [Myxococcota bacterium]
MALEDILRAIERDGDDEVSRIRREADEEAERILAEAREGADRLEAERAEQAERHLARERRILLARARMQADRTRHRARHAVWERVAVGIRERLAATRGDDGHRRVLAALVRECFDVLPDGARLDVDARDSEAVAGLLEEIGREVEVREDLETWGGVVLHDDAGHTVRNTLEDRLDEATRHLRRRLGEAMREG